jgi:ribonuclease Z
MNLLDIQLVNGPCGDPAVLVTGCGPHVLFDAGSLEPLSNKEILKIKLIAISHTHVDHFIGFDRIIRANIPHFRTIEIIGPQGIIENVRGKLNGYTWNLLEADQIIFIVHEVLRDHSIKTVRLSNTTAFSVEPISSTTSNSHGAATIPIQCRAEFAISASVVDHGMDVLAFKLTCKDLQSVDKDQLIKIGLKPGPWISKVQDFVLQQDTELNQDEHIHIDGKNFNIANLAQVLIKPRPGQSIVYITDMAFTAPNINQIRMLCRGPVDTLICEANFKIADHDKARSKSHLTTRQAAILAQIIQAKELKIFHISDSYGGDFESSHKESQSALKDFSHLSIEDLQIIASKEYTQ